MAAYTTLSTTNAIANIEFASAAVPLSLWGKPVTFQAGWRRLYQLTSKTQGDTTRVPLSAVTSEESVVRIEDTTDGSIDLWSLAGAVRLTSRLSLGVSVDLYGGDWLETSSASEDPGVAGPTDFSSFVTTNRVDGHNLNLGLLLAYPSFRVGAVYHQGFWSDYRFRHPSGLSPRPRRRLRPAPLARGPGLPPPSRVAGQGVGDLPRNGHGG